MALAKRRRLAGTLRVGFVALVLATAGCQTSTRSATPAAPTRTVAARSAWIAYQSDSAATDHEDAVWLIHPDGTGNQELVTGLRVGTLLPDWSPDGMKLVVASRGGKTEPLYEYDLKSEKTTQLFACTGRCVGDDEPAYSHDGRYVAFTRYLGPFVSDRPSDCGLWVGDRRTRRTRQLTSNKDCDREYYVRWSPDGHHLTYHRELTANDGTITTAVYTINSDGTGERRLTDPAMGAGSPDWSPGGRWIVFNTHPLNVFQTRGPSVLYRMHPDGTGLQQLSHLPSAVRATEPRYTPDGAWILFVAVNFYQRAIWAMPAEGGRRIVVADKDAIYTHPTLQPIS